MQNIRENNLPKTNYISVKAYCQYFRVDKEDVYIKLEATKPKFLWKQEPHDKTWNNNGLRPFPQKKQFQNKLRQSQIKNPKS